MNFHVRKATAADVPRLREVIDASVRGLQTGDYSPAQIAGALQSVYGVDSQLIADGTYLVAEVVALDATKPEIIACGGGASAKRCTEAISTRSAKTRCWIPCGMRQRFARFSCIRIGPGAVSGR